MTLSCTPIKVLEDIVLYHTGPALDSGPLPSFFYFSLSGKDSLTRDPYNQPVQFLFSQGIRIFSLSLPFHEEGELPENAVSVWAGWIAQGSDFLDDFFNKVKIATNYAVDHNFIDPSRLAVGGLSRGAFIATHVAARDERFSKILGFAPLTVLSALHPAAGRYDLIHQVPNLENKKVRFYIGNLDTRVNTRSCFEFIMALSEAKKPKPSDAELFISKSLGKNGHGTSPEIFKQGSDWIAINL
jgi:predicted esterase